ncbi:MAG: peroxiredoxin [Ignavibacteriae bacterium]|nr:MAG: peroxiredoxin [Ignavibacteriota bacterium]
MKNQIKFVLKILPALFLSIFSFTSCKGQDITLKEGDEAPDFSLQADDGRTVKLSDYQGVSNVVLYFYPKDQTMGCTKEACSYRDNFSSFKDANAEILGVSVDDVESHKEFKQKENLNFTLLADPEKEVTKKYGVLNAFGTASRVTFVIDKEGKIRKIFPKVDAAENYKEVLEVLKSM